MTGVCHWSNLISVCSYLSHTWVTWPTAESTNQLWVPSRWKLILITVINHQIIDYYHEWNFRLCFTQNDKCVHATVATDVLNRDMLHVHCEHVYMFIWTHIYMSNIRDITIETCFFFLFFRKRCSGEPEGEGERSGKWQWLCGVGVKPQASSWSQIIVTIWHVSVV